MAGLGEFWLPLVDEPIGTIVARIQEEDAEIGRLVNSPRRLLAFRTFAYIRIGIVLGQLLVDHDLQPYDDSENWVEALLRDDAHHAAIAREVRLVAEQIAADPAYAEEEPLGPDEGTRERFRAFARERLESG
jgi:hypothetical protein